MQCLFDNADFWVFKSPDYQFMTLYFDGFVTAEISITCITVYKLYPHAPHTHAHTRLQLYNRYGLLVCSDRNIYQAGLVHAELPTAVCTCSLSRSSFSRNFDKTVMTCCLAVVNEPLIAIGLHIHWKKIITITFSMAKIKNKCVILKEPYDGEQSKRIHLIPLNGHQYMNQLGFYRVSNSVG